MKYILFWVRFGAELLGVFIINFPVSLVASYLDILLNDHIFLSASGEYYSFAKEGLN